MEQMKISIINAIRKFNSSSILTEQGKENEIADYIIKLFSLPVKQSAGEILMKTKNKHNIGVAWEISKPIILEAMEEYASQFSSPIDSKEDAIGFENWIHREMYGIQSEGIYKKFNPDPMPLIEENEFDNYEIFVGDELTTEELYDLYQSQKQK